MLHGLHLIGIAKIWLNSAYTSFLPGIWINENTWLFDVLPEKILGGKVQHKAGAATCSIGQSNK